MKWIKQADKIYSSLEKESDVLQEMSKQLEEMGYDPRDPDSLGHAAAEKIRNREVAFYPKSKESPIITTVESLGVKRDSSITLELENLDEWVELDEYQTLDILKGKKEISDDEFSLRILN